MLAQPRLTRKTLPPMTCRLSIQDNKSITFTDQAVQPTGDNWITEKKRQTDISVAFVMNPAIRYAINVTYLTRAWLHHL